MNGHFTPSGLLGIKTIWIMCYDLCSKISDQLNTNWRTIWHKFHHLHLFLSQMTQEAQVFLSVYIERAAWAWINFHLVKQHASLRRHRAEKQHRDLFWEVTLQDSCHYSHLFDVLSTSSVYERLQHSRPKWSCCICRTRCASVESPSLSHTDTETKLCCCLQNTKWGTIFCNNRKEKKRELQRN